MPTNRPRLPAGFSIYGLSVNPNHARCSPQSMSAKFALHRRSWGYGSASCNMVLLCFGPLSPDDCATFAPCAPMNRLDAGLNAADGVMVGRCYRPASEAPALCSFMPSTSFHPKQVKQCSIHAGLSEFVDPKHRLSVSVSELASSPMFARVVSHVSVSAFLDSR